MWRWQTTICSGERSALQLLPCGGAGAIPHLRYAQPFFFINQMIVQGSRYWNVGIGLEKGDVKKDDEGLETMKVLGENMAWLMKKIKK